MTPSSSSSISSAQRRIIVKHVTRQRDVQAGVINAWFSTSQNSLTAFAKSCRSSLSLSSQAVAMVKAWQEGKILEGIRGWHAACLQGHKSLQLAVVV
jgi:hypothetical protein